MPGYYVNQVLASNGLPSIAELEARLPSLAISEQQHPSVLPPHDPRHPFLQHKWQQIDLTVSTFQYHGKAGYEAADPFSLDDEPGVAPTSWTIPQGLDSGYHSRIPDPQPESSPQQAFPYVVNESENDNEHDASVAPPTTVDYPSTREYVSSSTGFMFDDQAITGIGTDLVLFLGQFEDDDISIT